MWQFRKKTKQPKVLLNRAHIFRGLMPIQKQPLSEEEMGWVRQSLSSRKDFVGFHLPQLFAVAKCPCGTCRTLGLEPVELPNLNGKMGWVRQSLSSRKDFVGFHLPQLFAVAKCPCGTCRTLGLEPVELPNLNGKSGHLGGITIETKDHGPIEILLHANQ